jgi:hypothetical protein
MQEIRDCGPKHSIIYTLAHVYFQVLQAWTNRTLPLYVSSSSLKTFIKTWSNELPN